jgi:hypothetical protein
VCGASDDGHGHGEGDDELDVVSVGLPIHR